MKNSWKFHHDTSVSDIVKVGLSLQNSKNFQTWEPFIFSNARFFYRYETVEQFLNATFFRQTMSQNLRHKTFLRLVCTKWIN